MLLFLLLFTFQKAHAKYLLSYNIALKQSVSPSIYHLSSFTLTCNCTTFSMFTFLFLGLCLRRKHNIGREKDK